VRGGKIRGNHKGKSTNTKARLEGVRSGKASLTRWGRFEKGGWDSGSAKGLQRGWGQRDGRSSWGEKCRHKKGCQNRTPRGGLVGRGT